MPRQGCKPEIAATQGDPKEFGRASNRHGKLPLEECDVLYERHATTATTAKTDDSIDGKVRLHKNDMRVNAVRSKAGPLELLRGLEVKYETL